jgi:hypothetical protein
MRIVLVKVFILASKAHHPLFVPGHVDEYHTDWRRQHMRRRYREVAKPLSAGRPIPPGRPFRLAAH